MNLLNSLKTLALALILSVGIGYAYAAWSNPTATPPGGNITTPVNIGNNFQTKQGGLLLNELGSYANGLIVRFGNVGIGDTTPDGTLKLDVEGSVGATAYCDQNGSNCTPATALGGGGGLQPLAATDQVGGTRIAWAKTNIGGILYAVPLYHLGQVVRVYTNTKTPSRLYLNTYDDFRVGPSFFCTQFGYNSYAGNYSCGVPVCTRTGVDPDTGTSYCASANPSDVAYRSNTTWRTASTFGGGRAVVNGQGWCDGAVLAGGTYVYRYVEWVDCIQ